MLWVVYISGECYEKQAYGVPFSLPSDPFFTHVCIIPFGLQLVYLGKTAHTRSRVFMLRQFNLMVGLFVQKASPRVPPLAICVVRLLRQKFSNHSKKKTFSLIIFICFVLNKENELFLCLRISKMLSLRVFDRCESC